MNNYGRGERVALVHPFGEDIATFAEVRHHLRGGLASFKTLWLRASDPAVTPRRPPGVDEAVWQWLCEADRRWAGLEHKLGPDARDLALELVRRGCGELQTSLDRTVQWPPAKWIPHPDLRARRLEERAQLAHSRRHDQDRVEQLASTVDQEWPGLATALRGTRHRQWLTWIAEDLMAGETFDGPRAFAQHHTGDTKARDSLLKDLLDVGVEPQILSTLGINRNPYIGLGGPVAIELAGRRLDLSGWPGPLDIRVPADQLLVVHVATHVETLAIIENRQAAETVCDTHPEIVVVWCHGQPPGAVLQLIATAAGQASRTLICPDADLGGVLIADRVVTALPADTEWRVLDVGGADHPTGELFGEETRRRLAAKASRDDSLGSLAQACLDRGYAVEQEASTRATILNAIAAVASPRRADRL